MPLADLVAMAFHSLMCIVQTIDDERVHIGYTVILGGVEVLCQRWRLLMIRIPTCAQAFRIAEAAVCTRKASRNAAEKAFSQAQYITM